MSAPLQVTVSNTLAPELLARARACAEAWGLPFFQRDKYTGLPEGTYLVLGGDGWTLRDPAGTLRFSEGLARLRIKRLEAGERDDVLVRLCELEEGDQVLDCTFGLGADAQVCAHVVGSAGRVVGLEKSLPLWALASEGLKAQVSSPRHAPIELRHADCLEFLRAQAPQSFDCVLFDPMFGKRKKASPAFDVLRAHAEHAPLPAEAIGLARRVARRWVVVKGARYTEDLKRLGLHPEPTSRFSEVVWARVRGGI
ncbi:MAG: class I SAM-dependent methyltransferase [Archangiaceae bacterium]|nr:class I SAM-dependent methyltransferase [Archangiaceae bacterium]